MTVEFLHNDLSTTLDRFSVLIEGKGFHTAKKNCPENIAQQSRNQIIHRKVAKNAKFKDF